MQNPTNNVQNGQPVRPTNGVQTSQIAGQNNVLSNQQQNTQNQQNIQNATISRQNQGVVGQNNGTQQQANQQIRQTTQLNQSGQQPNQQQANQQNQFGQQPNQQNQFGQQPNQQIRQTTQLNQFGQQPNQQQANQQNQFGQQTNQQNQLNQQSNVNKTLASRQSKVSAEGVRAANEAPQPSRLQQPAPRPPIVAPQHNLQSRQSKMSVVEARQQATRPVVSQVPRVNGSRQSKLSIMDPVIAAPSVPRQNINRAPNELSQQLNRKPNLASRQSKLSVVDQRPPRQRDQQPASRRSNQSIPVRRPQQSSPNRRNLTPTFQTRNRRLTPQSIGGRVNTASTTALSTYSEYETLDFFPLVVGKEEPEIFIEGIQNYDGWMSEPDTRYPIDVILGLDRIADVYKVFLTVADHLTPSKVEIRVGRKRKEDDDPTYETARSASYDLKATMRFEKRNTDLEEKETKVAFVDSECQYIWLLFHAPHSSRLNPTNQIRIAGLTIEGYSIEPKRQRTSRSMESFRDSITPPRTRQRSHRRNRSRASTAISNLSETQSIGLESRNGRVSRISSILGGYSINEGEGWRSNGDNLAEDPLMAVRLIRNLLSKKQKKALKRGRDVQATVCLRAVETLSGYEKEMTTIKRKMSEALQQGNVDEARKQELSLIDCRDTAFRVIHLDLLLGKAELLAVGIQSKYSNSPILR